jgi:phage gp36-like protein
MTAADLDDEQWLDAIAEADAIIDGYLGGFYGVPVAVDISGQTPHPVDYWSRNIAAYNATLSYRQSQDFGDDDPVARRYNATIAALDAVAKGKMTLQLPGNQTDTAISGVGSAINPNGNADLFPPSDFDIDGPVRTGGPGHGPHPFWIDSRG